MTEIKAPDEYIRGSSFDRSLFLAGGISNCPDWQTEMKGLLVDEDVVLVNPRRDAFDLADPNVAKEQIVWEHRHLRRANAISFWFPKETLCPITLLELGYWLGGNKPVFIGVHPEYARKFDVEVQTELERPEIKIVYSLEDLVKQVKAWYSRKSCDCISCDCG